MVPVRFPLLIAQTPRAGHWNHVTLIPPGGLPVGTDTGASLSVGTGSGANYVAVSVDVDQPTTGRSGREVLVLIGVVVPAGDRLAALEASLRARLCDLGAAVGRFDWDMHLGGPACLPELVEWRNRLVAEFALEPNPVRTLTPLCATASPIASRQPWWVWFSAAVGTALLVAGLLRRCGAFGG